MTVSRTPVRDALACLVCHKPGPDLEFDHVLERSTHPQLRDDPTNIAPLCGGPYGCHWLKSNKKIRTWVEDGVYCWKKRGSDVTIRIPVKVDTRYGCLVPMEASDGSPSLLSDLRVDANNAHTSGLRSSRPTESTDLESSDAAEQTDGSGPELVEGSASSPGAEGPPSAVPATDAGDDPLNGRQSPGQRPAPGVRKRQPSAPNVAGGEDAVLEQGVSEPSASLMVGEGEASQFLVVTPPSVDTPRVNAAVPRPSPSPASLEDWLTQDWSVLTDDELQTKYDAAEKMQGFAYLLRCKALYAYRENHVQAWGESWTEQAIERFGISRRTCQAQANIWEICVRRDAYTEIAPLTDSRSLMQAIGRQSVEKGVETMEAAIAYFAEYAEPPTVKALVQEEQPERERCICPTCHYEHWAILESGWKA